MGLQAVSQDLPALIVAQSQAYSLIGHTRHISQPQVFANMPVIEGHVQDHCLRIDFQGWNLPGLEQAGSREERGNQRNSQGDSNKHPPDDDVSERGSYHFSFPQVNQTLFSEIILAVWEIATQHSVSFASG
jgi:hypothetical protein